uniref:Uncharacterized protein n=1 Tax=Ursus americanus TaxID=9643 RepID=A0A452SBP5_URSAM
KIKYYQQKINIKMGLAHLCYSRLPRLDCVLQGGKYAWQCLKEGNCKALKCSFFECKRSMLDARSRSGGRKGHLVLLC